MMRQTPDLRAIRDSVALVGRLSDSIVRLGPLSLGIDGILSWIPGIGELYSTLAGGFIIVQGLRGGVPVTTLAAATALMFARTLFSAAPIAGALFADVFTAHKWAAAMVVRSIDERLGARADEPAPQRRPAGRRSALFA